MLRTLDWRRLLTEQRVPFVEKGANVKRGEVNIQCPFCGSADPSHHMGLNLETGWWSCWRNRQQHSGKSPLRLLMRLLRVSYWKAREIAGLGDDYVDPDGFDAVAARIMGRDLHIAQPDGIQREFLQMPAEFVPFSRAAARFDRYMRDVRKFGPATSFLHEYYGLHYARTGSWRDRVILPYYMNKELVAWTGRAIAPSSVRYRDLEREECLVPIKETLYNFDAGTQEGRALVLVEGPLDALKTDAYGKDVGVRAVALSTNSASDAQMYILEEMAPNFNQVLVVMDNASELSIVDSMRMRQRLQSIPNSRIEPVPFGAKDPGDLSPEQVVAWTDDIARRTV